jgi:hypothetical protein
LPKRLPNCLYLDCSETKIEALSEDLNKCEYLNCSNCSSLKTFPNKLDNCKTLNAHRCTSVEELPETLPLCTSFNSSLTAIRRLPALPLCQTENINTTGCTALHGEGPSTSFFKVPFKRLKEEPKQIVLELGNKFLLAGKAVPSIRYLEDDGKENVGLDLGGVQQDCLTKLIQNLCKWEREIKPEAANSYLPIDAAGYPIKDEHPDTVTAYKTLGRLLAFYAAPNSFIKAGPLFNDGFYTLLSHYSDDTEEWMTTFFLQSNDKLHLSAFLKREKDSLGDKDLEWIYGCLSLDDNMTFEAFKAAFQSDPEKYRNDLLITAKKSLEGNECHRSLRARFLAVTEIAKEMKTALGEHNWVTWIKEAGDSLKDRIQGTLSAKQLLSHLDWRQPPNPSPETVKAFETTKNYLLSWILDKERPFSDLEKFVYVVSGCPRLSSRRLRVVIYQPTTLKGAKEVPDSGRIPVANTCTDTPSLQLPSTYPNQEHFNEKFEELLATYSEIFSLG